MDFSHERDLTIDELVLRARVYMPDEDFALLKKSYYFAEAAHREQKRSSGEEYIIHPLNVVATLIKLRMDMDSLIAGILHDVVEDCDVTPEEIEREFSTNIAHIVVGLTKISKIKFKTKEENQAENFRKMVVAMAKDIRVIIVKLSDRMHNMRTLQYMSVEKQKKKAEETLEIYVPLANRLGINSVKAELEDLCLRYSKPEIYYRLAEKVAKKRSERDAYIRETVQLIRDKLQDFGVKAEVYGRPKHFFSIYKKMLNRGVDFEQIQDLLAFRIIVNNITECYKALGVMHSSFTPVPGRFKDYIAIPKINNYQSLHTTVICPRAERIEIQIRTHEMHEVAERGVAAHWKYKEIAQGRTSKMDWVQELLDFNQNVSNSAEFMDAVKNDLDFGGIFIFTPTGDVKELSYGSTPLDFAYAIHTEVGNTCVGAKVNGRMVPLKYRLKSGDTVEILTSKTQTPGKDWLKFVKTSRAKTKIKQFILKIERDKQRSVGEELLEKSLKMHGTNVKNILKNNELREVFDELHLRNIEELYIHLGSGRYSTQLILEKLPSIDVSKVSEQELKKIDSYYNRLAKTVKEKSNKENAVIVDGMDDLLVRLAKCCNPIPGDPIIGFITRGRGITVHTASCTRISEHDMTRTVPVEWNKEFAFKHPVNIRVMAHDRPGILANISKIINAKDINIKSAMAKSLPDQKGSFIFEIEVKDYSELLSIIGTIESIDQVLNVTRV